MSIPPIAATVSWPTVVLVVAVLVALCLWGLFRRGSVADRARHDAPSTDHTSEGGEGTAPR